MRDTFSGIGPVHYLPILTTLFSIFFLTQIGGRYLKKGGTHLLWWAIGVFTYGLGTFFEAFITLHGVPLSSTNFGTSRVRSSAAILSHKVLFTCT
jgi:hypothetical protein